MATRGRKQSVSAQDILLTMINDAINDVSDGNYLGRVASGRGETAPAQAPSTYGYLQAARTAAPAAPAEPVAPVAPAAPVQVPMAAVHTTPAPARTAPILSQFPNAYQPIQTSLPPLSDFMPKPAPRIDPQKPRIESTPLAAPTAQAVPAVANAAPAAMLPTAQAVPATPIAAAPIAIANPNAAEAVPNAPTPVLDEPISPENASTPWRNELANAIAPYAIRDVVNAYNAKTQPIRYLMDTAGMVGNYISNTIAPAVSGFIGNTFSPSKMIGTLGDMILNGGEPMGTQPVQEIRQPVQEVYRYPVQEVYRYPVQENR